MKGFIRSGMAGMREFKMRRVHLLILAVCALWLAPCALMLAPLPAHAAGNPRYASIVIDSDSGAVIRESRADTVLHPASLTKMMTLYLAFDALERGELKLDQTLKVSAHAASMPRSNLGLKAGDRITVDQAIRGMTVHSANDAAVVLAEAIGGSERTFAQQMTRQARMLGMNRTLYRNANGLPDARQVTSARDTARLARALIRQFPQHYHYFGIGEFEWAGITWHNTNKLLGQYPGMDGLKTGYINASGFNLASSAKRDGRRIIAVVFGGRSGASRNAHMVTLLDYGFAHLPAAVRTPLVAAAPPPPPRKPERAIQLAEAPPPPPAKPEDQDFDVAGMVAATLDSMPSAAPPGWGIQVGAFQQAEDGNRAIASAAGHAADLLGGAQPRLEPTRTNQGLLYRAQFLGLSRSDAARACARILSGGLDCMAVAPRDL